MKFNNQFLTLFLSISLLIFSCGKDDTDQLCEDVICNNGGTCVDGICDCPAGYEGTNCDEAKTPVAIKLTRVTVKNFPVSDAFGSGWDVDSKADIRFEIIAGNDVVYLHMNPVENANPDDDHSFEIMEDLTFLNINDDYIINLLDKDEPDENDDEGDDVIDSYVFKFYSESTGLPGRIELRGGSSEFDLDIEYLF